MKSVFTACFKLFYPILLLILIVLIFRLRQQMLHIFLGGELAKEKKRKGFVEPIMHREQTPKRQCF